MKVPNPGSDAALDRGCLCPVLDNGHGRGYMGMPHVFVYRADCPLHRGADAPPKKDRTRKSKAKVRR